MLMQAIAMPHSVSVASQKMCILVRCCSLVPFCLISHAVIKEHEAIRLGDDFCLFLSAVTIVTPFRRMLHQHVSPAPSCGTSSMLDDAINACM